VLGVVIGQPAGAYEPSEAAPTFGAVVDLMTQLSTVIRTVAVATVVKDVDTRLHVNPSGEFALGFTSFLVASLRRMGFTGVLSTVNTANDDVESLEAGDPDFVKLGRISMNTPLTMEVIVSGVSGAGIVTAVVYLFKNPAKIGEWFPKLQTSWYDGRAEAERAKQAYKKLREAKTEMRELEP
jgi:hypothetical protein